MSTITIAQAEQAKSTTAAAKRRRAVSPGFLFALPHLILFTVFLLAPTIFGFYISLHHWHVLAKTHPASATAIEAAHRAALGRIEAMVKSAKEAQDQELVGVVANRLKNSRVQNPRSERTPCDCGRHVYSQGFRKRYQAP